MSDFLIEKCLEKTVCEYFKRKKTLQNITLYLELAYLFNLPNLAREALKVVERCYTSVIETKNFLHLSSGNVKKVLLSSELHITSELEIFNAAEHWIGFNAGERTKFAKILLQTVRLTLLSDATLQRLLLETSLICNDDECRSAVESVLLHRKNVCDHKQSRNVKHRYCSQSSFDMFLSSRRTELKKVAGGNLQDVKIGYSVAEDERFYKAVVVSGTLYTVVREQVNEEKKKLVIKRYVGDAWEAVAATKYRNKFCVCNFMKSIFIIGGRYKPRFICFSSVRCDVQSGETSRVAGTARFEAACAAFDGGIVACGGFVEEDAQRLDSRFYTESSGAEAFDHAAGTWTRMPDMVRGHHNHSLVAIGSKLFVVATNDWKRDSEVFDKSSNKFAAIASPLDFNDVYGEVVPGAASIGKKIIVFGKREKTVVFYDTEKDEWSEETWNCFNSVEYKSCVKLPLI